jgi:uncharacterized CHY-type Zn-finger protein
MGRSKKYHTEEELVIANREKCKRYYNKNKEHLNKKRMEKYWENKDDERNQSES